MKVKSFLFILIVLFFTNTALAGELYSCSVPDWSLSPFARIITNAFGCNLAAQKTAKIIIKKLLKENADGDYQIKLDSYSAVDLKRGKFKSVEIYGEDISSENGIYVSTLSLKTLCEYNHVDYTQDPIVFYTDVPMSFSIVLSEEDLNNTLIDVGYIKKMLEIDACNVPFFYLDNINFKIKHNKIYLIVQMKAPLLMGERKIKITLSGKLNVENGKIVLDNLESENLKGVNLSQFISLINKMNPFEIPLQIIKGNNSKLRVNNVRILDNKICIDGIIVMKRSLNGQKKEEK